MANISDGTPGMAATTQPPNCIHIPGAVPQVLGIGSAPAGTIAWTDAVAFGHGPPAATEHLLDAGERLGVKDQFDAGHLGQRLARQVVLSGSETARRQDQPGPL
jgi:hypothetical protein